MMKDAFLFCACLFGLFLCATPVDEEWGYEETNGPNSWKESYPICGENSQSPIAIDENTSKLNSSLANFDRTIFGELPNRLTLENTGHSLQVNVEGGYTINNPTLLPASFKISQFHLHWGKPNEQGSEHTLNGNQYFGELHIVHYNTKYQGMQEAASKPDGLAVLGFFIEKNYPQDNLAFSRILYPVQIGSVKTANMTFQYSETFSVETILPPDYDVYFRYKGSLTTPPCYESVLWTVFETPIRISAAQASTLETSLSSEPGKNISGNFRPPQPLNNREVERSPSCLRGTASFVPRSFPLFFIGLFLSLSWLDY